MERSSLGIPEKAWTGAVAAEERGISWSLGSLGGTQAVEGHNVPLVSLSSKVVHTCLQGMGDAIGSLLRNFFWQDLGDHMGTRE